MQRILQRSALVALALFLVASRLGAGNEAGMEYVSYSDNDLTYVTTEGVNVGIDITPKTRLTVTRVIDGITAASRKIPIIDGVSSATSHTTPDHVEYRRDISVGIAQRIKNNTFSVTGDNSGEDDYSSVSWFLSWTAEFDNRNQALTMSYADYSDKVFPFGVTWTDTKASKIFDLGYTRVLTPRSQMRLVGSYASDEGYLSNPYHRVVVDNYYFSERHPSIRDKAALGIFYTLGFEGSRVSSLQFDYRYYNDNWDVRSHTGGIKYNRYLTEKIMGSLRGRYYNQGQASFWKNEYPQEELYMTGDTKLAAFSAFLYGAEIQYEILNGVLIDAMFEQYVHSSSIDYAHVYNSVSKSDLVSQIIYISMRLKL